MFFDSHAHLDLVEDNQIEDVLKRAVDFGVGEIISCATSFYSNEATIKLAQKCPQIKSAIGLYPLNALELNEEEIEKAFSFFNKEIKRATAIGEVGLDYKYSTKEDEQNKQVKIFSKFISLSKEFNKPLIIHSRFAQRQVLNMLIEQNVKKALLHSFVDSKKLMNQAVSKGYYVSVGLSILYNEETQKNIKQFPLENLLLETDSPIYFSGEKATPEKIIQVAQKVAQLKEIELKEVEESTQKNFLKLFKSQN